MFLKSTHPNVPISFPKISLLLALATLLYPLLIRSFLSVRALPVAFKREDLVKDLKYQFCTQSQRIQELVGGKNVCSQLVKKIQGAVGVETDL